MHIYNRTKEHQGLFLKVLFSCRIPLLHISDKTKCFQLDQSIQYKPRLDGSQSV